MSEPDPETLRRFAEAAETIIGMCRPGTDPVCCDCGIRFRFGDGFGEEQLFCSETCADSFRAGLGA